MNMMKHHSYNQIFKLASYNQEQNPPSKVMKWLVGCVGGIIVTLFIYLFLIPFYTFYYVPEELPKYTIAQPLRNDDTLRIAFIGDSWADYHAILRGDTIISNAAKSLFPYPVKSSIRGKKGALSKEVYFFMYADKTEEHTYEPDRCTQPLLEDHPDYCVIFAGINDVTFLYPTSFYAENMKFIINLLLYNRIRPVVMEIPLVNFKYPMSWFRFHEKWFYRIRSVVMGTWSNEGPDYHQALNEMLERESLRDSILYIAARKWNPEGCLDTTMFLEDNLHLNLNGYHRLDSCMASEIIQDYLKRKARQ